MMRMDPAYGRLIWKEYRAQRGFWLALAVAALAMMLLFGIFLEQSGGANAALGIAMLMPAFYALGSGAMLFAAEREEGTSELLSILAPRKRSFFLAKVGFSLGSTLLLATFLSLAAGIFIYRRPGPGPVLSARDFILSLCAIFAVFGWAAFFSAVCRKVLTAVILAGVTFVLTTIATQNFLAKIVSDPTLNISDAGIDSWLVHLLEGFSLLALAAVFTGRLLGGRSFGFTLPRFPRLVIRDESPRSRLDDWAATRPRTAPGLKVFGRLLWIELRQALTWGHAAWLTAIGFFVCIPVGSTPLDAPVRSILSAALFAWLLGIWAFHSDDGTRVRPLAERGVSPTVVWFSRQVFWAGLALFTMLPLLALAWSMNSPPLSSSRQVHLILSLAALGYAVGQFASMLNRKAITAAFCAALLYLVFGAWTIGANTLWVPWWLSVAPLPLIFLSATWAWSRNWLLERSSYQALLRLGGAVGVALLIVWGSVGVYRVHEIPLPEVAFPGNSLAPASVVPLTTLTSLSRDELTTSNLYAQAVARLNWIDQSHSNRLPGPGSQGWDEISNSERAHLDRNSEALELALAATSRDTGAFPRPTIDDAASLDSVTFQYQPFQLTHLLLLSARSLESQGKLDEARDRYLAALRLARHVAHHAPLRAWQVGTSILDTVAGWIPRWAMHPDQTPQSIEAMAQAITRELEAFPPLTEALQINQAFIHKMSQQDERGGPGADRFFRFRLFCPWEPARTLRVLNLASISQDRYLAQLDKWLSWQVPGVGVPSLPPAATDTTLPLLDLWIQTTPLYYGRAPSHLPAIRNVRVSHEIVCRALPLELRLIAWKKEHGTYPPRLDSLPAIARASTIDPWTGREFVYFPGRDSQRPDTPELPIETSESDAAMAGNAEPVETVKVAFGSFGPWDAKIQNIPGAPVPTQANPSAAHPLSAEAQQLDHQIWFNLP